MTYLLIYFAIGIAYTAFSVFRNPETYRKALKDQSDGMKSATLFFSSLLWPLALLVNLGKLAALATPRGREAHELEKTRKKQEEQLEKQRAEDEHRDKIAALVNRAYELEPGPEQAELLAEADRLERDGVPRS